MGYLNQDLTGYDNNEILYLKVRGKNVEIEKHRLLLSIIIIIKNSRLFILKNIYFFTNHFKSCFSSKKTEMKNILVTGGCGFIASNFLNYMVKKYFQYNFINLDALYYCASKTNVLKSIRQKKLHFCEDHPKSS